MANPSQCALLTNNMHGSHHTDFAGRELNMPKPSQSMSTNEYGKVFMTEFLVQALHIRLIRSPDSTDPPSHGMIIST